uniref:Uncharacterized protein n=1 Tax=Rhizophora mucronata TaxID=61149 RepID=A0A2P2QW18_RHIMU
MAVTCTFEIFLLIAIMHQKIKCTINSCNSVMYGSFSFHPHPTNILLTLCLDWSDSIGWRVTSLVKGQMEIQFLNLSILSA